jgi:DNA-binding MarR family transcriptional regulator
VTEDASPEQANPLNTADRLHSASIHLLRRVARHDAVSGLTAARLSALSVIVYGGPVTIGELARAERVTMPTVSRLIQGMERDGLVTRAVDTGDRSVVRLRATERGETILREARSRRVESLARQMGALPAEDLRTLERAADILDQLSLG